MKEKFFVDTSFWKALIDRNEKQYSSVSKVFAKFEDQPVTMYTTDYIFSETVTLIRMRSGLGNKIAREWGNKVLSSPSVLFYKIDEKLFHRAWAIFQKYQDKEFSFVDCSSFALMEEKKIETALTLDRHFEQYGFKAIPVPAVS